MLALAMTSPIARRLRRPDSCSGRFDTAFSACSSRKTGVSSSRSRT